LLHAGQHPLDQRAAGGVAQARRLVELLLADPVEGRDGAGSLDRGAAGRVVGLVQAEALLVLGGVWVLDRDGLDRRLK
jgi:hypothetical protein